MGGGGAGVGVSRVGVGGEEGEEEGGDENAEESEKEALFTEDVTDGTDEGEPGFVGFGRVCIGGLLGFVSTED